MIGIFDSGYGGLSIFKSIEEKLPQYDYIYLGDNARAPYGDVSQAIIYKYTTQAIDYLFTQGCDLIILACNTASALALRKIQQEYLPNKYKNKNVLGVIRPLVEKVASLSKNRIVAIMGTTSTIESQAYIHEFANLDPNIEVVQESCPLLVPLIESSREDGPEAKMVLTEYIRPLKQVNPDVLVLACTHYNFLNKMIQNSFGLDTLILNSGKIVAEALVSYLKKHPEYTRVNKKEKRIFLTTNDSDKFNQAAQKFLGRKIKSRKIFL